MDQRVSTAPAHGVSPAFIAMFRRQQDRDESDTFFGVIGGESMCDAFARDVVTRVVEDRELASQLAGERGWWTDILRRNLIDYWSRPDRGRTRADTIKQVPGANHAEVEAAWSRHLRAATAVLDLPVPVRDLLSAYFLRAGRRALA